MSISKENIESRTSSDSEDADVVALLEEHVKDAAVTAARWSRAPTSWSRPRTIAAFVTLLCISNLLTFYVTYTSGPLYRIVCKKHESVAEPPKLTPLLRDLNLQTKHVKFNSTFFDEGTQYRGPPSPETDAAWESAGADFGFLLIPEEHAEASDLSSKHIHLRGGEDQSHLKGIPADVEVFHQLHCLNLIRKSTWYNYDYYRNLGTGPFQHPDKDLSIHVDHCINNLRQRIMCTSDVGLVPFYWVGDDGGTDPDFSRMHTCRDFESLRDWMTEHMTVLDENSTLLPRPGDYRVDHFH